MKSIKNWIFLLLFFSSAAFAPAAFASGKRVWTFDYKKWNLPEHGNPQPNPNYKVQFTPDNKILISFLEHKYQYQPHLDSKTLPEKFVVLLAVQRKG